MKNMKCEELTVEASHKCNLRCIHCSSRFDSYHLPFGRIKELLRSNDIPFKEIDMINPEILTDLSMKGVFARMAPILQIDDKFYNKEIIDGNKLNVNKVKEIIRVLKA